MRLAPNHRRRPSSQWDNDKQGLLYREPEDVVQRQKDPSSSDFLAEPQCHVCHASRWRSEGPIMTGAVTSHTTNVLELQQLKCMIAEMGGCVQRQLVSTVDAFLDHDKEQGEKVILGDDMLDVWQRSIGEKAIVIMATRQAMPVDLRAVVSILRIASDLESIGDLATNMAK